ncbi:hypothetical protein K1719_000980 [Acacia pycnantha]|nr:hypothetical protein K1719_000980 [Acacia pycnantha]
MNTPNVQGQARVGTDEEVGNGMNEDDDGSNGNGGEKLKEVLCVVDIINPILVSSAFIGAPLMGYYYCRPRQNAHTSNVVLFLLVALTLLSLPRLFSGGEEEEEEEETSSSSALMVPFLVLVIVILVSFMGSPRKDCAAPPCYRCKHGCYCYGYPRNC